MVQLQLLRITESSYNEYSVLICYGLLWNGFSKFFYSILVLIAEEKQNYFEKVFFAMFGFSTTRSNKFLERAKASGRGFESIWMGWSACADAQGQSSILNHFIR